MVESNPYPALQDEHFPVAFSQIPEQPTGQVVHEVDPEDAVYVPSSHSEQKEEPLLLYIPAEQAVQLPDPSVEYVPAAHVEQAVAPSVEY